MSAVLSAYLAAGFSESWLFWTKQNEDAKWPYNILQLQYKPPSLLPPVKWQSINEWWVESNNLYYEHVQNKIQCGNFGMIDAKSPGHIPFFLTGPMRELVE